MPEQRPQSNAVNQMVTPSTDQLYVEIIARQVRELNLLRLAVDEAKAVDYQRAKEIAALRSEIEKLRADTGEDAEG